MAGHPDDEQLKEWDVSPKGHERAAAAVARWARGQQKWAMVPEARAFRIDEPAATITRALNLLVEHGVLVKDGADYFVAIGRQA
jgi:hypothetical protein